MVRVTSCDNCGAVAVFLNGETPEDWRVGTEVLCPVCLREVA
jgi:hypothetical protein